MTSTPEQRAMDEHVALLETIVAGLVYRLSQLSEAYGGEPEARIPLWLAEHPPKFVSATDPENGDWVYRPGARPLGLGEKGTTIP